MTTILVLTATILVSRSQAADVQDAIVRGATFSDFLLNSLSTGITDDSCVILTGTTADVDALRLATGHSGEFLPGLLSRALDEAARREQS